jgi:alpha-methylacyl-CoA racemase
VLEFLGLGPGPFAATMLADLGADVVAIARPGSGLPGFPDSLERGRPLLRLDLRDDPAARADVLAVAARADVLIEGFRPGVMERLGLGPDAMRARNPRLVYARVTGWGQSGPLASEAGHDINYAALAGALHLVGPPTRPPSPPANLLADYAGGGLMLVTAVLAALHERERTGAGRLLDVAMTDGVAYLATPIYALRAHGLWSDDRGRNLLDGGVPWYGVYECADGRWVAVGALEDKFYAELLDVLGLDASELPARSDRAGWPVVRAALADRIRSRTRDEWAALAAGRDACLAPVLDLGEVPAHPQHAARGTFAEDPATGSPTPRLTVFGAAPRVAEDPRAILRGWDVEDTVVERLARE